VSLPRLYAVLDTGVATGRGWTVADLGQAFLDGGAQLIQLRAKHLDARALLDAADRLVRLAEPAGARIIVNDRADVAAMCGAAGVHLGQEDLRPRDARALLGDRAMIGLSTHTPRQVDAALDEPIDYIAVGPIYGTSTKDTGYAAVGLDLVRYAEKAADTRPVVAIGGITLARAPEVLAAGAASVAVISDLLETGDPTRRVAEFLAQLSGSG
jgi:thiamine-phosphate pyrophosphorylase